jgi:hypothetical protein
MSSTPMRGLIFGFAAIAMLGTSGCVVHRHRRAEERVVVVEEGKKGGPPPWAPAHGYRRKQAYRYYYDREIYYNVDKGSWVWIEADGWKVGRRLPEAVVINPRIDKFAIVELEGDRPEVYHHEVVKVYPKNKGPQFAGGSGKPDSPGNSGNPGKGGPPPGRGNSKGRGSGK